MGDARHGLGAVVREAGPLAIGDQAEELDLFGENPADGSPVEGSGKVLKLYGDAAVRPARRGRPEGSRNVANEAIKRFLLARYRHPLLGLFDVAATPPAELAKLLVPHGGSVGKEELLAAWKIWLECAKEAAEYVTPKEPRALTVTPGSAPLMSINLSTDQLTVQGVTAQQVGQLGIPESAVKTMLSDPIGVKVLEQEVLQQGNSSGNSNA